MGAIPVERVRYVGETAHGVDHVHGFLRREVWRDTALDEQPNDLALTRLRFLSDEASAGASLTRASAPSTVLWSVSRDAVEATYGTALDQLVQRALAIVREVRMKVEVDPHRSAATRESRLL